MKEFKVHFYNLLRWSERYTKTDMVYLVKSASWLSLGQATATVSSFFLAVLFANALSPEVYGSYKYALAIGVLLALPGLNGINAALVQTVSRGNIRTYQDAFRTKLIWSLLGTIGGLVIAFYYAVHGNMPLALVFSILAVCVPLAEAFSLYDSLLQGKMLFRISTRYSSFAQLALTVLIGASVLLSGNLVILVLAYAGGWLLVRAVATARTLRQVPLSGTTDPETIPYGKHLSVMGVVGTLANYADRLLIFHYLGAVELAIYTVATGPAEQLKSLFKNIAAIALPRFSRRSRAELLASTFQKTWRLALSTFAIAILFSAAIPFLYPLLFPKYPEAVLFAQVFAISTVGIALILPQTALQALSATRELYVLSFASAIAQIIALFIGVLYFGLWGVVIARVAVRLLTLLFGLVLASYTQAHSSSAP